jgi:hypothetical protein
MTKYVVKLMLDYEADIVVEANDIYEANAQAEALASGTFSVYNKDTEEFEPFTHITGYDPEGDDHEEN